MGIHPNPKNLREVQHYPRYSFLCPECLNTEFERKDGKHGLYFCEVCGYVTRESIIKGMEYEEDEDVSSLYPQYNKEYSINKINNIENLQRIYEKFSCNKQDYLIETNYKHYIGIVATHFNMTQIQQKEVKFLIEKEKGVNFYCKNCSYEQIILALCVMFMRMDGRRIIFESYSLIKEVGLTERRYSRILENVLKTVRRGIE